MLKRDDKIKVVGYLKDLIASSKTVGVLDMSKMPARQFLKIKNAVTADGSIKIKMARKGLLSRALKESKLQGVAGLYDKITDSPALIFSDKNPFKLLSLLRRNRATSSAKVGQIVPKDIVIPKGPTHIPPGPAITTLGKVGIKTRIEGGKIAIIADKTILKAGQEVTADMAAVFSMLKIEPVEIGVKVVAAWEDGMIYESDVLDVDADKFMGDLTAAVQSAINFSLNTDYIVKLTAPLAVGLAFLRAKALCLAAKISEKGIIEEQPASAEQPSLPAS